MDTTSVAWKICKIYCPGGTAWPLAKRTFWHLMRSSAESVIEGYDAYKPTVQRCLPQVARGQQCSGFVGTVCQKWATETHRRTGAEQAGKRLGAQGPAPQKAAKRQAGANRQVLAAEPSGDMAQR
eukprot:g7943.t1